MRRCGVGPLFVRTGSSSSSNEQPRTPRAARCKPMHRHECAKPLITEGGIFARAPSITRVFSRVSSNTPEPGWAFSRVFSRMSFTEDVSSTTSEPRSRQVHTDIDPSLAFERVSYVQSNFEQLRVSSVKSRLTRNSSISTCMGALLRVPAMMHRTPSMEMIEDFQNLEVQTDAADNVPLGPLPTGDPAFDAQ